MTSNLEVHVLAEVVRVIPAVGAPFEIPRADLSAVAHVLAGLALRLGPYPPPLPPMENAG